MLKIDRFDPKIPLFATKMTHILGFVGVAFTMGSLSMWFPQFLALAYVNRGDIPPCTTTDCEYSSVMMKFGIFTAVAGIVGVGIGLSGSATWKKERDGKPGNKRRVSKYISGHFSMNRIIR